MVIPTNLTYPQTHFTHPGAYYHADPQRTGFCPFLVGSSLEIAWTFNVGAEISDSPVVDNMCRIIFGSRSARLYCLNQNGETAWIIPLTYAVGFQHQLWMIPVISP